jgi:HPt (histidine-containing phosphotransfer) domain-containing protein
MADSPEAALRAARQQVIDSFDEICTAARQATLEHPDRIRHIHDRVHRLAGLAGVVGFTRVSARALDLQARLEESSCSPERVEAAIAALRSAFTEDLDAPPPPWLY